MSDFTAEHRWATERLAPFAGGLLPDSESERMEQHVQDCGVCRLQVGLDESELTGSARHVPDEILAHWGRRSPELRGLQRELVRRHLERCAECSTILRLTGHEPALPRLSGLEPTAEVMARIAGGSGGGGRPSTIRRLWSRRDVRIGTAVGGGMLAAAAALLIVYGPASVSHRPGAPTLARVTTLPPATAANPAAESTATSPPQAGGPAPSTPGRAESPGEAVAARPESGMVAPGGGAPELERLREKLAAGGQASGPAPPATPGSVPPGANAVASLRAEADVASAVPLAGAKAKAELAKALASVGRLRLGGAGDTLETRYAVIFELTPLSSAPAGGRGSRGGAAPSRADSLQHRADMATLTPHVIDLWTGEAVQAAPSDVGIEDLAISARPQASALASVLELRPWAGRVVRVDGREVELVGEGTGPPAVGDLVTLFERGADIRDEATGHASGFLKTAVAQGRVSAVDPGNRYRVRVLKASAALRPGLLAGVESRR